MLVLVLLFHEVLVVVLVLLLLVVVLGIKANEVSTKGNINFQLRYCLVKGHLCQSPHPCVHTMV